MSAQQVWWRLIVIVDGQIMVDEHHETHDARTQSLIADAKERMEPEEFAEIDVTDERVVADALINYAYVDVYLDIIILPTQGRTYTLAEIRNGTGWPQGARFIQTTGTGDKL